MCPAAHLGLVLQHLVPAVARGDEPLRDVEHDHVRGALVEAVRHQRGLQQRQQRLEAVELGDLLPASELHLHVCRVVGGDGGGGVGCGGGNVDSVVRTVAVCCLEPRVARLPLLAAAWLR